MSRKSSSYRSPLRFTDAEGNTVVRVYLCDGSSAVADAEDFDRLVSLGFSPRWFPSGDGKGRSYVCVGAPQGGPWKPGRRINVARLIVAPFTRGLVVGYRDRDRLNLRRSNLVTKSAETNAKAREGRFLKMAENAPSVAA